MLHGSHALTAADSVPLAHALCAHVASQHNLRALSIKGPVADAYGLRPPRVSADADVLVPPSEFDAFIGELAAAGWRPRDVSWLGREIVTHSITLLHESWPCDIDVHSSFPGFLGDPADVFETLWRGRRDLEQAGIVTRIPSAAAAVMIGALHALRTPAQTGRHEYELGLLIDYCARLTNDRRAEITELAVATGAVDAGRPFLETLGTALPSPTPFGQNPALDEWRARVAADGTIGSQIWIAMSAHSWPSRLRLVGRILWPTRQDFGRDHPEADSTFGAATKGRLARLARGLGQFPRVVHGRVVARRGRTESSIAQRRP
jgi:hypothetical protein